MTYTFLSNAAHGRKAHDELEERLRQCLADGYLSAVVKNFRVGDEKFGNDEQFYAPFMVQFSDRQRWLIYSTTSCRTDRIKGQQWDAENLKRLDASIEAAFLVHPDEIEREDEEQFVAQREKYSKGYELSYLDDIFSFSSVIELIQKKSDDIFRAIALHVEVEGKTDEEIFRESETQKERLASLSVAEIGKLWDFSGRSFEKQLAAVLEDRDLLKMWKADQPCKGCSRSYGYFSDTLRCFGLDPSQVSSIVATAEQKDIGLLPNGGQPKTDVLVRVKNRNGVETVYTISCKRTNSKWVSAHQYKADDFHQVLAPENGPLGLMLHAFQYAGSISAMGDNSRALAEMMAPYAEKLTRWVLGGDGGAGDPITQHARFIATFRPSDNTFSIHSVDDYTKLLMSRPLQNFMTPFHWTYASGQRQKSIQLKMPIIEE